MYIHMYVHIRISIYMNTSLTCWFKKCSITACVRNSQSSHPFWLQAIMINSICIYIYVFIYLRYTDNSDDRRNMRLRDMTDPGTQTRHWSPMVTCLVNTTFRKFPSRWWEAVLHYCIEFDGNPFYFATKVLIFFPHDIFYGFLGTSEKKKHLLYRQLHGWSTHPKLFTNKNQWISGSFTTLQWSPSDCLSLCLLLPLSFALAATTFALALVAAHVARCSKAAKKWLVQNRLGSARMWRNL